MCAVAHAWLHTHVHTENNNKQVKTFARELEEYQHKA